MSDLEGRGLAFNYAERRCLMQLGSARGKGEAARYEQASLTSQGAEAYRSFCKTSIDSVVAKTCTLPPSFQVRTEMLGYWRRDVSGNGGEVESLTSLLITKSRKIWPESFSRKRTPIFESASSRKDAPVLSNP